jgi:hypothetical protein
VDEMKTKLEQSQNSLTKAETQFKTFQTTLEEADKQLRKTYILIIFFYSFLCPSFVGGE